MNIHRKAHAKWPLVLLCILTLTLFLVACGESGGSTTTAPTPTPTPTGNTYNGNGYTLSYPAGWVYAAQGPVVVFKSITDPTSTLTLTITPATPFTNLDQAFTAAQNTLKAKANYQQDSTVPSQASIGGDNWQETGGTYNDPSGAHIKGAALGDQHPSGTGNIFIITLTAKADSYDQVYNTGFKPMLDSFKFTS